ncbi:MAG: sigma-54-dependent Fis family transcriptional regulator [Myxococcales bacterium]|nr:sigma-54-dependent Fis family transcriptional regulator [Myxococcales bacterium]HQY61685.1 sigma-54 dependent transcriptional regulator [Polyangiaceae bacterium]
MGETTDPSRSALVVDDDTAVAEVLGAQLRQAGFSCAVVHSGAAALEALEARPFSVVLSDLRMPGMDGLALMREVAARWPDLPVVILTAHGTVASAVEAMKAGAADYLQKPFERAELLYVLGKVLEGAKRGAERAPSAAPYAGDLVGDSAPMREVRELVARAARSAATVLIHGETGTGKELIARAIHDGSARAKRPFIKLHCAALPDALLESELFGYEKGAFTGATQRKPGRVELAHEGTLFLDEIGDITPATQVKLLRVLQEREFERLGGTQTVRVDVRFVAATHRDLASMVAAGQFREDLYYRLNVVPLTVPPLRARPGDVEALALRFVAEHAARSARPVALGDAALARLRDEPWPGNVRQLQNFVERLVVLSDGPTLTVADVDRELQRAGLQSPPSSSSSREAPQSGAAATLHSAQRDAGRDAVREALERAKGNRTLAARLLGISRRALYYKLDEYVLG